MTRGGSSTRSVAARSAAAAKGWAARKKQAAVLAAMTPAEREALRGSQADRVLAGSEIRILINAAIAALRAREDA